MLGDIFSSIKQFFDPEIISPLAERPEEKREIKIPPSASRGREERMRPYKDMMSRVQESAPVQSALSAPGNFIEMIKRLLSSEQTRELSPPQPTPSTIRAVKTTYPTSTPTSAPTPVPEKTIQTTEGRSDKFRKISKAYPENYCQKKTCSLLLLGA